MWDQKDVEWGGELAVSYGGGQGRNTDRMVTEQKLKRLGFVNIGK